MLENRPSLQQGLRSRWQKPSVRSMFVQPDQAAYLKLVKAGTGSSLKPALTGINISKERSTTW